MSKKKQNAKQNVARNVKNLRPVKTTEEARKLGRAGGIALREKLEQRRTLREAVQALLSCTVLQGTPMYEEIKRNYGDGIPEVLTVLDAIVMGVANRAVKGDPSALRALAELSGEMNAGATVSVNAPPIIIGIHNEAYIAEERRRQEEALAEIAKAQDAVIVTDAVTIAPSVPPESPAPSAPLLMDSVSPTSPTAPSAPATPAKPQPPTPPQPQTPIVRPIIRPQHHNRGLF